MSDGSTPFNPLDKRNLGRSVAEALLRMEPTPLPHLRADARSGFVGAGVYAIYFTGIHRPVDAYEAVARLNRDARYRQPIYVGRAVPRGARKAGVGLDINPGRALFNRLREHAESIEQVDSLDSRDFACRYLVVDDIWIPLGESLLIRETRPVWNLVVDGFGNHDPGGRRAAQQRSPWDVIHPGRPWVAKLGANPKSAAEIESAIDRFLAGDTSVARTVEEAIIQEEGEES